jgi:lipopolysaccharide transport system ATP-binding protein
VVEFWLNGEPGGNGARMSDVAIRVAELCKQYRIGARQKGFDTLRETLTTAAAAPFRKLRAKSPSTNGHSANGNCIWALKDVSFEVKQGDVVGIIGRNGAGKSTLLKILTRITEPTSGYADIKGRVASLLEVGTGFHPELSGRDNILLNGAILGMKKAEIERKFDEIVAFSEIEKFIDTPVKHYSSGMYLRLAFAVAAHLEPEILLVDEVLAVGDASFQRKCLGKMGDVARQGRTVLLVSHNMASINRLSDNVVWLKDGVLQEFGDSESVIANYLSSDIRESAEVSFAGAGEAEPGSEYVRLLASRIKSRTGEITTTLDNRFEFSIEVDYKILRPVKNVRIGITLTAQDSTVVLSSKDTDHHDDGIERPPGTYSGRCTIPGEFLNNGQYSVSIGCDTPMIQTHFFVDRLLAFHIEQIGGANSHITDRRPGFIRMKLAWETERVDRVVGGSESPAQEAYRTSARELA